MELNLITLSYLFFRLAPFIIVSYFSLSSIFNQDLKGLIYLVGLLLATFVTIIVGNTLPIDFTIGTDMEGTDTPKVVNGVCNMITIGKDGSFSRIPLGLSMLTYTLIYLVYIIAINHIEMSNLPTLIILPLLILGDLIWNITNNCYTIFGLALSIACGGLMGWAWGAIVESFKQPRLFFLNVGGDKTVCHRPSKQLFKCTFKKSGLPTNK
jgi:hypothetical protein